MDIEINILIVFFLISFPLFLWARHESRLEKAAKALVERLKADPGNLLEINYPVGRAQLEQPGYPPVQGWRRTVLEVTPQTLAVHWRSLAMDQSSVFCPADLRWFGRPHKYTSGDNEIWLHFERGNEWWLLKIRLGRESMRLFVRALKAAATPELVTAYRRRRPYVHAGPLVTHPAEQDLQGAWHLQDTVVLYLMPRVLVVMQGTHVLRTILLEAMQGIGALRRLDNPRAAGLVRFRAEDEDSAFALRDYEGFAESLAQAARLTLEDPVERKQKKQTDEDYEWDE
jgi:hypothetical protein